MGATINQVAPGWDECRTRAVGAGAGVAVAIAVEAGSGLIAG
jgi:hypothetical protein